MILTEHSAVLTNSVSVSTSLRRCLIDLGGLPISSARPLGIDFWAASKTKFRFRIRALRKKQLAKRMPRLTALQNTNSEVASRAVPFVALLADMFDARIYVLFGGDLLRLRNHTARVLGVICKTVLWTLPSPFACVWTPWSRPPRPC